MTTKMILDCDPGHDDAIAILLALGSPEIDLLGITTIGGNHSLEKVTFNARAVCELAGRPEVPVHAGCMKPLVREAIDAPTSTARPASTASSCPSRAARRPSSTPSPGSSRP